MAGGPSTLALGATALAALAVVIDEPPAVAAPTALTCAISGRLARGIVNRFFLEHSADAPSGYPQVHHLTAPLRAAARERGGAGGCNLWAGQARALAAARPAAETVRALGAHDVLDPQ